MIFFIWSRRIRNHAEKRSQSDSQTWHKCFLFIRDTKFKHARLVLTIHFSSWQLELKHCHETLTAITYSLHKSLICNGLYCKDYSSYHIGLFILKWCQGICIKLYWRLELNNNSDTFSTLHLISLIFSMWKEIGQLMYYMQHSF